MSLQVQIGTFEGPLSLLLFLIKKNEVDICDIPIHEITKQYLEYIQIMKELNLEVAGEFVAMAATLIYIKSRMLVPQYNEQGEEIIDDPRKELVQKLLEYQKYKEAGKLLYNRDLWVRGSKDPMPTVESEIILDERGLFALIAAFRQLMKEAVKTTHEVYGRGMSISARLIEIKHRFIVGERIELRSLLSETFTKKELLITFLSVLELCRMSFTRVYQTEAFSSIYIETIKVVSSDVVNRVQEFDSTNAAQTADQLMFKAEEDLRLESLSEEASSHIQEEMLDNDAEVKAVEAGELI